MKIVRSRRPVVCITVPVRGGYRVQFDADPDGRGSRAVVPDDVATVLVGNSGGFFIAGEDVADLMRPGAAVLVIRDSGLGDLLMATPLIRRLAERGCVVDVLTHERYRCLFENNPAVRATRALESDTGSAAERAGYEVVLDLRLVAENAEVAGVWRHRADAFAAMADITLTPEERTPDYCPTADERAKALPWRAGLLAQGCRAVVGYVWRSSTGNRNWSNATHAAMLNALLAGGYGVLVLGDRPEGIVERLFLDADPDSLTLRDLTGALALRDTAAVMSVCDAVVTPDTGLFHLAGALGLPTVAYFGAFPAAERQAHRRLAVLNAPDACGRLHQGGCRSYRCLNQDTVGQSRCLGVPVADVLGAVAALTPLETALWGKEAGKGSGEDADAAGLGRPSDDGGPATAAADGDGGVGGDAQPPRRAARVRERADRPGPDPAADLPAADPAGGR